MLKTHLAITLALILIFIASVQNVLIFIITAFIATFIPDIDNGFSTLGKSKIFRPLQFFLKHRGLFHSFTFLILITVFFVLFFPIVSFGFFLGYSSHIFADSFTSEGIQPFYPFKKKVDGWIKTGGKVEISVMIIFIIIDLILLVLRISSLFQVF